MRGMLVKVAARRLLSWFGTGFLVGGCVLLLWATPSPHALIEVFIGLPLMAGGGVLLALAALLQDKSKHWLWRVTGWGLLVASGLVLVALMRLVWAADLRW
jgi:hypothetical protein